jgi:hypothetical protein
MGVGKGQRETCPRKLRKFVGGGKYFSANIPGSNTVDLGKP